MIEPDTPEQTDAWARGMVYGLCRVVDRGGEYPIIALPFVRLALRWIKERRLDVHPVSLAYAYTWLSRMEPSPRRKKMPTRSKK